MQQLHVKKGGSTDLEINIKDMLKNVSKEKTKGSLMHEIGMGKIIIIIVCGIIILAGSFLDGSGSKNSSSDDVSSTSGNELGEDEALNVMNIYAKRQEKAAACNFLSIKTHIKLFYCDLPIFRRFYRLSVYLMCKAP